MRTTATSICLAILLFSARISDASETVGIDWKENVEQVNQDEQSVSRPMLIYMTAPGCGYCVRMKKQTFANEQVIRKVRERFTALKIDVKKHKEVSKRLKVKLYPTTAIVHPSGTVVDIIPGFHGPKEFLSRLAAAEKKLEYQTKLLATKPKTTTSK